MKAEIWWGLHFINQNQSFASNTDTGFLLKSMFPDSQIALCYKMSDTKSMYTMVYGGVKGGGGGSQADITNQCSLALGLGGGIARLLDIASCGLHSLHNRFRDVTESTGWDIGSTLGALCQLFKDTPARREDYTSVTGSSDFPLRFCSHRWVKNIGVAMLNSKCK